MEGNRIERMHSVLKDFRPKLADVKDQRRRTASRFNVAEAFGVSHRESAHSEFLAYLLDPSERHDQGDIFLNSLLHFLGLSFQPDLTHGARVTREATLGADRRVDILIRLADGQFILIENKVMAEEGPRQVGDYQEWLKRQGGPAECPHKIVFLTPDGRQPKSTRKPDEVICLSYARLADWIGSSLGAVESERLRVTLEQYAETCRQIGGSTRRYAMSEEICQIFLDPDRLETALEMEAQLSGFRRSIHETFWQEAEEELTERLRANGHDLLWEVRFDDNLYRGFKFRNWRGWQIAWQDRRNQPHFAVRVEFWPGEERGLFFGITRGAEIQETNEAPQDTAIRARLHGLGFTTRANWWPGLRFFHECGLPRFDLSRVDDVLELGREMQNDDRPLKTQVVDLIWDLFCRYRGDIEDLNRNYPYA